MQASKRPIDKLINRDGEPLKEAGLGSHQQGDYKAARLAFVGVMLREMRELSVGIREPMLVYLLEMAILEAEEATRVCNEQKAAAGTG